MRLILAVAAKDWRLFWADRRAALLSFLVPILLASAFGAIFDRPTTGLSTKLPLLIVCESEDPAVRAFVHDLLASPRLEAKLVPRGEAELLVADRRPGLAIVLAHDCNLKGPPRFDFLHHPLSISECQWAEGVLTEALMQRFGLTAKPFHAQTSTIGAGQFNSYAHSFSGMTLQYLLFWGMESGLLLLRERQRGVWRRVRAAPVPLAALLLGRAIATAFIALLQVFVTFAVGWLVFDVVIGSWSGFLLLALAISALAASTGLIVAALGGTEARARSVSILAILGIAMLSGLWLPAFLLPGWVRDLGQFLPTTWAMRGLDGVTWQGRGWSAVLPAAGITLGFTVLFLGAAGLRLAAVEARRRRGFA